MSRTLARLVIVALLILSGCASTNSTSDEGTAATTAGGVASPVADLLGLSTSEDFVTALELRRAEAIETSIDLCMARAGFEYERTPVTIEAIYGAPIDGHLDPLERAKRWGLAISPDFEASLSEPAIEEFEPQPNDAIKEALSQAELSVWLTTLRGNVRINTLEGTAHDPDTGEIVTDPERLGCVGQAQRAATDEFGHLTQLIPRLEELDERAETDPRVIAASNGWARCMAEQGYSFADREEMWHAAFIDFGPLRSEILDAIFGGDSSAETVITDDTEPGAIPAHLRDRFEAHKAAEIATAVASVECDLGIDAVRDEVRRELEQEYITNNRSTLEDLKG